MANTDMEDMAARFADRAVSSVFLYTREAHPAENYRHHTSMDDKRAVAQAFKDNEGVKRRILLDDMEGTCHNAYGLMPNMTYIVGRGGLLLYKAGWTDAEEVEKALNYHLEQWPRRSKEMLQPVYTENILWRAPDQTEFMKGLERNGPQAIKDMMEGMKHMPPPELEPEED
jgi:hypothetical protein